MPLASPLRTFRGDDGRLNGTCPLEYVEDGAPGINVRPQGEAQVSLRVQVDAQDLGPPLAEAADQGRIDATIIRSFLCEGREIPARNGFCLSKREKFFYFFPLYLYIFLSTCSIVKLRVFPEFLYGRESALTQIITVTNQKGGVGKTTRTKVEWKQEGYRSIIDKAVSLNQKYTSYSSKTNLLSRPACC